MPGRSYVLHEASYLQVQQLKPNVAVLPWGATEGHNYHLPHGTDVIEATMLGEAAVQKANQAGAKCLLLPTVPFGNNNQQLTQTATITMRSATQLAFVRDVADSLVRQRIDRLVILNFHGGNEFKAIIRDVMLELPIFIVRVDAAALADYRSVVEVAGDHADEFETSLLLHLTPQWVDMAVAGDGATTPYKLTSLKTTPGVWTPRNWAEFSPDTGVGDPRKATAEKGRKIFELFVNALTPVLREISAAQQGDFPFCIRK